MLPGMLGGREDQLTRTALLSPVYGIVKAIAITTPGGVVEPGGKLMEIVPLEDRLLIETRVAPRDIAWIRAGLRVQAELNLTEPLVARGAAGKVEALRLRRQVSDLQGKIDEVHNDYTVRTHEEQVKNSAELDAQLQVADGEASARVRTLRATAERLDAELSDRPLQFSADIRRYPQLVARETQLYESRRQNLTTTLQNLQQSLKLLLIWAHVAVLDEVTTGSGKVTPSSRAQIIDNLDGGILKQLSVREGDIVRKGELLATLDPARYQSS
ncbi:hypothetical protein CRX72_23210 [Pantoea sp. BRM17]|nr:hypothetical protein CRX72_23210 [Pantoea sp. BRM17]